MLELSSTQQCGEAVAVASRHIGALWKRVKMSDTDINPPSIPQGLCGVTVPRAFARDPKKSRVQISAGPLPGSSLGQAAHTHAPLSPSSIIWYRPMSGDALLAGKVTAWRKVMTAYRRVDALVTCGLTACTPGSTLGNEYWKTLPLPFSNPQTSVWRVT